MPNINLGAHFFALHTQRTYISFPFYQMLCHKKNHDKMSQNTKNRGSYHYFCYLCTFTDNNLKQYEKT